MGPPAAVAAAMEYNSAVPKTFSEIDAPSRSTVFDTAELLNIATAAPNGEVAWLRAVLAAPGFFTSVNDVRSTSLR
jgi:hypothetical protein